MLAIARWIIPTPEEETVKGNVSEEVMPAGKDPSVSVGAAELPFANAVTEIKKLLSGKIVTVSGVATRDNTTGGLLGGGFVPPAVLLPHPPANPRSEKPNTKNCNRSKPGKERMMALKCKMCDAVMRVHQHVTWNHKKACFASPSPCVLCITCANHVWYVLSTVMHLF